MPHDERRKRNGHIESTILLRSLGIRAQDVVDIAEDWHESDFRSTLHQLDEETRCSNEGGIEIIAIVYGVVSPKHKPAGVELSLPTCWRTRSTGSECQSSSLAWVKDIWGYTKEDTSVSKWGLMRCQVDLGLMQSEKKLKI